MVEEGVVLGLLEEIFLVSVVLVEHAVDFLLVGVDVGVEELVGALVPGSGGKYLSFWYIWSHSSWFIPCDKSAMEFCL